MEVHSNFKNNWLSRYHNLEEEGEEKSHAGWGGGRRVHCLELEMYWPNWD